MPNTFNISPFFNSDVAEANHGSSANSIVGNNAWYAHKLNLSTSTASGVFSNQPIVTTYAYPWIDHASSQGYYDTDGDGQGNPNIHVVYLPTREIAYPPQTYSFSADAITLGFVFKEETSTSIGTITANNTVASPKVGNYFRVWKPIKPGANLTFAGGGASFTNGSFVELLGSTTATLLRVTHISNTFNLTSAARGGSYVSGTTTSFSGGSLVIDLDQNVHVVPLGIKFSNTLSTYSTYAVSGASSLGGVLAHNGDIHFIPYNSSVGQKVSRDGVVSTYSLIYTTSEAYAGGILSPNGDIHFIPYKATVGQKISAEGIVSTYSGIPSPAGKTRPGFKGACIGPEGEINFIPACSNSTSGTAWIKVYPNNSISSFSIIPNTYDQLNSVVMNSEGNLEGVSTVLIGGFPKYRRLKINLGFTDPPAVSSLVSPFLLCTYSKSSVI